MSGERDDAKRPVGAHVDSNAAGPQRAPGSAAHGPGGGAPGKRTAVGGTLPRTLPRTTRDLAAWHRAARPPATHANTNSSPPNGSRAPTSRIPQTPPAAVADGINVLAAIDARAQTARDQFAGARACIRDISTAQATTARADGANAAAAIDALGDTFAESLLHGAHDQGARMTNAAHLSSESIRASAIAARATITVAAATAETTVADADEDERASIREEASEASRGALESLTENTDRHVSQLGIDSMAGAGAMSTAAMTMWEKVEPGLSQTTTAARDAGEAVAAQIEQLAITNLSAIDDAERDAMNGFDRAKHSAAAALACRPGEDGPSRATSAQHQRGLLALDELNHTVSAAMTSALDGFTSQCEQSVRSARITYELAKGQLTAQLLPQAAAAEASWRSTADQFVAGTEKLAGDVAAGHAPLITAAPQQFRELAAHVIEVNRRSWYAGAWEHLKSAGWGLLQFAAVAVVGAIFIAIDLAGLPIEAVIALAVVCAGLAYLTAGLIQSIITRSQQANEASTGLPWYSKIVVHLRATAAAAGDAFMVTPAVEFGFGYDAVSGKKLTAYERGGRFADAAAGLATMGAVHYGMSRLAPTPGPRDVAPNILADRASELPEPTVTPRETAPIERATEPLPREPLERVPEPHGPHAEPEASQPTERQPSPRDEHQPARPRATPAARARIARELAKIPVLEQTPEVVPLEAREGGPSGSRNAYYVSEASAAKLIALFQEWGPDVEVRNYRRGILVRSGGGEWYFERLSDQALADYQAALRTVARGEHGASPTNAATHPGNDLGLPPPNAATIEVWGFRGVRKIRGRGRDEWTEKEQAVVNAETDDEPLLYAGHVGISFDGGRTIYGLTPDVRLPGGDRLSNAEALARLKAHEAFPGRVRNDTEVFQRAEEHANADGWNTSLVSSVELVEPAFKQKVMDDVRRMQAGGHDLAYSFPLLPDEPHPVPGEHFHASNGYAAERVANCAVFPSKLGVPIPEPSGNLTLYIPELERWSQEEGPKDFRAQEGATSP